MTAPARFLAPVLMAALMGMMALVWAQPAQAAPTQTSPNQGAPIIVRRVVLSEPVVKPSAQELVQVTLYNPLKTARRVGILLEVRDARGTLQVAPQRKIAELAPRSEARLLFTLTTPAGQGQYDLVVDALTPDFKAKLTPGDPPYKTALVVTPGKIKPGEGFVSLKPPPGLLFEKADLLWEDVSIVPTNPLPGEKVTVRATLRNVGGDIAKNAKMRLDYFNVRLPLETTTVGQTQVILLAPGEKVELEFPFTFPEKTLEGDYQVLLRADVDNVVDEADKQNNVFRPDERVRLSSIRLVFPEKGYTFDDTGMFVFRWEAVYYSEFKVQIGTDPLFENPDSYFDIPQGDKWTSEKELSPLSGELPDMALGLQRQFNAPQLYWRVQGRQTDIGKTGSSLPQPFKIYPSTNPAAKAPAPGTPAPDADKPGPEEVKGPKEK